MNKFIRDLVTRIFQRQKSIAETSAVPSQKVAPSKQYYEQEQKRMIEWLAQQPPLIVDAAAKELNWDFASDVLVWILNQPTTDAATAVWLFYLGEPSFYLPTKSKDGSLVVNDLDNEVVKAFITNWPKDFYSKGSVIFKPKEQFGHIIEELEEGEKDFRASGMIPWAPLKGIAGPFKGKKSKELLEYFKTDQQTEYFIRALFEDLGTWFDGMDEKNAAYRDWRLTNGFGLTPTWQNE